MTLLHLLLGFGSGVFGATIGAMGAFIFTGITALIGIVVIAAGGDGFILNEVAFGLFGPHVSFSAGVAAAAFAANKKKLLGEANGTDITTPMFSVNDYSVILVGGIFGIIGQSINYFYSGILNLQTDTIGLTVVTIGIIVRFAFGNTGLLGKFDDSTGETRRFVPDAKSFMFMLILALGYGLVISYVSIEMNIPSIGFAISAASLIFMVMGFSIPGTHHIALVAGSAAVLSGSIYLGTAFAVLAMIVGEIFALTFCSHHDTHIDPPAGSIFICMFLVLALF